MVWVLAWSYSPEMREAHAWWYVRIGCLRVDIEGILDLWPHLRAKLERDFAEAYTCGREVGSQESDTPRRVGGLMSRAASKAADHDDLTPVA